jgi:hypothetical protein
MTAAVVLMGVALRLLRLDSLPGVNGDEAWMGVQAQRLLAGESFEWRTPTGNPLNPFTFFPLLVSHSLLAPSVAQLRWVAAASGLLLLPVNFALARMTYGLRTAVVTTVALAVLPDTIAYSRFGWDSSQSVLFTLPVLYLPLAAWRMPQRRGWLLASAALAWVASLLVHPTNVLTAPLWIVPGILLYRDMLRARFLALSSSAKAPAIIAALILAIAVVVVGWPWWRAGLGRIFSLAQASEFARLYVELFSGVTIYRYISGTLMDARQMPWGASDVATFAIVSLLMVAAIGWGLVRMVVSGRNPLDRVLLAGVLLSIAGFYLVAGPWALRPHSERYAQCLIAGGVLLAGRGVDWYLNQPRLRRLTMASLLSLASLSLIGFVSLYWLPLSRASVQPHPAFRTGPVEPKKAALALVLNELGHGPTTIGAGSWWTYWPLAYLALPHQHVQVVTDAEFGTAPYAREPDCWIELVDTPSHDFRADQPSTRRVPIMDPAGREILTVFFSEESTPQ